MANPVLHLLDIEPLREQMSAAACFNVWQCWRFRRPTRSSGVALHESIEALPADGSTLPAPEDRAWRVASLFEPRLERPRFLAA